jgi:hypothetical protein
VEELSRWCGRCGTELRSGARFCSKCGQRVINEEPAAGSAEATAVPASAPLTGLAALFAAPTPAPEQPSAAAAVPVDAVSVDAASVEAASVEAASVEAASVEAASVEAASPDAPSPEMPSPAAGPPPPDDWSRWYADTAPRSPFQPPANQPPAYQPPSPSPFYPPPPRPPHEQPRAPQPPEVLGWAMRPSGPDGPGGSSGRERRSRAPLWWSALSVAVVAAVVVFLFLLHPFNHHATVNDAATSTGTTAPASAAATSAPATSAARSASSAAVTERQAASTVAGMLASSVADRTAIDNAYNDVDGCGPNLDSDAAVFTRAANSRRAMLASLASMPGRSALPPALLSDLANAWQASLSADQDLATWASDEAARRCVPDDTSDPGYQATVSPDNQADQDKTAFVAQWNPIATSYGLTTYQQDQL